MGRRRLRLFVLAGFVLVALAGTGCSGPPEAPTYRIGCDDPGGDPFVFTVRYGDEEATVDLPPRFSRPTLVLPQVRAASGARFVGDGVLFWTHGEHIRLDVDGLSFGPCAFRPLGE